MPRGSANTGWRAAGRKRGRRCWRRCEEYFDGALREGGAGGVAVDRARRDTRLAAVLAARAAHELRAYDRRDAYLARAAATDRRRRTCCAWSPKPSCCWSSGGTQDALERLKALPRKHTAALRLELKAQQQARQWEQVAALAGELESRGVFDAAQAGKMPALRARREI